MSETHLRQTEEGTSHLEGHQRQSPSPSLALSASAPYFIPPHSLNETAVSEGTRRKTRSSSIFGVNILSSLTNSLRTAGIFSDSDSNNVSSPSGINMSDPERSRNRTNLSINIDSANTSASAVNRNSISNPNLHTPNVSTMPINDPDSVLTPPTANQMAFHQNHSHDNQATSSSSAADPKALEDEVPLRNKNGTYSIRLTPYVDNNSTSTALYFGPIIRKLKPGKTISVGRYTEKNKEALTASPNSSCPVVFKSKVVSRTHAEIGVDEHGNWFLKDLKSSSGTFLNHRRLSPANQESEFVSFKEGDLLQLGMDFRGGTEEIYRCVKMRVELNKSWIRKTKAFSKEAYERMKKLNPELLNKDQVQCVICLEDITPCQAVFISPCSHSYHYKCIRRVIFKTYPQFLCPTCRALSDLEVDDDESDSDMDDKDADKLSDDASFRSGISDIEMTR